MQYILIFIQMNITRDKFTHSVSSSAGAARLFGGETSYDEALRGARACMNFGTAPAADQEKSEEIAY